MVKKINRFFEKNEFKEYQRREPDGNNKRGLGGGEWGKRGLREETNERKRSELNRNWGNERGRSERENEEERFSYSFLRNPQMAGFRFD